jgi:hypothetical protein
MFGSLSNPFNMFGNFSEATKAVAQTAAAQQAAAQSKGDGFKSILDSDAYRKLKQGAESKGASPWAALAASKQNLQASQGLDKAAEMANNQMAQQMSGLASSGGLTSGARERVVSAAPQNYLRMAADTARTKDQALLDIGMADAKQKQGLLGQVGELEMKDIADRRAFETAEKDRQAQIQAARAQADATRNSGKK